MRDILVVEDLAISFGGLKAVQGLSFRVAEGSIHALIGPNGAGKTTVLNCLSRFYDPDRGSARFLDHDLFAMRDHQVAALGIARTFQNLELFGELTVLQNMLVARHRMMRAGVLATMFRSSRMRAEEREQREKALAILELLNLTPLADTVVSSLPYGQQKLVELARAAGLEPRLLLLDEPAAGMNSEEVKRLGDLLRRVREAVGTILLVEHNMSLVMSLSDRITVMNHGQLLAEGTPEEVRNNPQVIQAYLGGQKRGRQSRRAGAAAQG